MAVTSDCSHHSEPCMKPSTSIGAWLGLTHSPASLTFLRLMGSIDTLELVALTCPTGTKSTWRRCSTLTRLTTGWPRRSGSSLVKGDVCETVPRFLEERPETIIALAYFDLDLYEPTKATLDAIRPHLADGAVVAFDEYGFAGWPGETPARRPRVSG